MEAEIRRAAEYYEIPIFSTPSKAAAWATKERGFEFIRPTPSRIQQFRTEHRLAKEAAEEQYVSRHSSVLGIVQIPIALALWIGCVAGFVLAATGHF